MMPNDSLGRLDRTAGFLWRQPSLSDPLTDYHPGGVALNNSDEGLNVQLWTLTYEGEDVIVTPEQGDSTTLFSRPGITELSLAFDSLMAPFVAFTDSGGSTFWWFNPATS